MTVVSTTVASHFLVHGSPNWVDLQTVDAGRSQAFYRDLFGWSFRSRFSLNQLADGRSSGEEPRATLMAVCDGKPGAEIIERDDLFDDMVLPSSWYPHLYVVDIEASLRRVEAAGGTVLSGPSPRGSLAIVATILDPGDALLCLWQPREMSGNALDYADGSLTWIELETPDVDRAKQFYDAVFGWTATDIPIAGTAGSTAQYTVFSTSVGRVAGAVRPMVEGIPASWCPAFSVDDVDAMTLSAARLGAVVMTEPYDLPIGRQSVIIDPGGAVFAMLGPRHHARRCHLSTIV